MWTEYGNTGELGAFADAIQPLDLRGQRVIAEVVGQAAAAKNGGALRACLGVPVTQMTGAIGTFRERIPSAIFSGLVAGMPDFENIAGGHSPRVYSRTRSADRRL